MTIEQKIAQILAESLIHAAAEGVDEDLLPEGISKETRAKEAQRNLAHQNSMRKTDPDGQEEDPGQTQRTHLAGQLRAARHNGDEAEIYKKAFQKTAYNTGIGNVLKSVGASTSDLPDGGDYASRSNARGAEAAKRYLDKKRRNEEYELDEEYELNEEVDKWKTDKVFQHLNDKGATAVKTTSNAVSFTHNGNRKSIELTHGDDGNRYAKASEVKRVMESTDDWLDEATDINDPSDGSAENEPNKKNNVDKQVIGGKGSKASNIVNKGASAPESSHLTGVKEDIEALTAGEDLSEEFKQKATTIFEAAVMNRVRQEVANLNEAIEQQVQEQVDAITEGLVEKVDGYLDYVVEQWMEHNEIAIERGMKSEILEGFVSGLKGLFEEHYIDVPDDKFDVVGSLEEEVDSLKAKLDETFESNVFMAKQITMYQRDAITSQLAEDMADTDKEKFSNLIEELSFEDVDVFAKKAQIIRESYFTSKPATYLAESIVTDAPVMLEEEVKHTNQSMRGYVSALNNLK